jgi:endonuclease/exonuclease/phosphatase family metal-dependent hydrolase
MRVLTYNIHGWRTRDDRPNFDALVAVIATTGAQIVALNEVHYPRGQSGVEGSLLAALAARLEMDYVFGPCVRWPAQNDLPADAYGNALLSRWPIQAGASHLLTPVAGHEQRGLLEARIDLPGHSPFTVYVTHLDHKVEAVRLTQLTALRAWTVRDRNRPHVVMGDFNAVSPWDFPEKGAAWQRLATHAKSAHMLNAAGGGPRVVAQMEKAGYVDAYRQFGTPGAQSYWPATDPPVRIDYIFVSAPLAPALRGSEIWHEAPGAEASDHRPVYADFDLDVLA